MTQFGNADLTLSQGRQSSFLISSFVFGNGFWYFPNVSLVPDMFKSLLLSPLAPCRVVALCRTDSHAVQNGRGLGISPFAIPWPALRKARKPAMLALTLGPFYITFFFPRPSNTNSFNFSSIYFLIFSLIIYTQPR